MLIYRCLFLGYDRVAQPVQTIPRVVTKVARPVLSVSITVSPTAPRDEICLMSIRILQWPVFSTPKKLYAFGMTDTSKSSECVLTPPTASVYRRPSVFRPTHSHRSSLHIALLRLLAGTALASRKSSAAKTLSRRFRLAESSLPSIYSRRLSREGMRASLDSTCSHSACGLCASSSALFGWVECSHGIVPGR